MRSKRQREPFISESVDILYIQDLYQSEAINNVSLLVSQLLFGRAWTIVVCLSMIFYSSSGYLLTPLSINRLSKCSLTCISHQHYNRFSSIHRSLLDSRSKIRSAVATRELTSNSRFSSRIVNVVGIEAAGGTCFFCSNSILSLGQYTRQSTTSQPVVSRWC